MNIETLKERYEMGRISIPMLKIYVKKGIISKEQFQEITKEEYE